MIHTLRKLRGHHEFWPPRIFELPYYFYLLWRCLIRGLSPKRLAHANWALDHGEIGIGSKLATQRAFDAAAFPPTILLDTPAPIEVALSFAAEHGYPLVLKPDQGAVGMGVTKVRSDVELREKIAQIEGTYMLQGFVPHRFECGVFYIRHQGVSRISGINRKHFPEVTGDGHHTILELAQQQERFTPHWWLFLRDLDTQRIPEDGEVVVLSFVGSHTMGCKFTDDADLLTPDLERAVLALCDAQPGYNFGRLDLKAADQSAFQRGEFVVMEANGVASLPTHMFDPRYTLWQSWKIFLEHGYWLVEIANEHRAQPMPLKGWREIGRAVRRSRETLHRAHQKLTAH